MSLKNGQTASDPRLDAIPQKDERSRAYPVRGVLADVRVPAERIWRLPVQFAGDQGWEGACVEFGISHELAAAPVIVPVTQLRTIRSKHLIYYPAQREDPWPGGDYPGASPVEGGTSLLAGLKVAERLGYFTEYRWSFRRDDWERGLLTLGPFVIAINWTTGMFSPNSDGLIHDTGQAEGGHCVAVIGKVKRRRFGTEPVAVIQQSWGVDHGDRGRVYLPLSELEQRLADDGEAAFTLGRAIPRTLPVSWDRV